MAEVLEKIRADRIRLARARVDKDGRPPTYEQIAFEVGCSVKTVYNVVTGKTHASP